MLYNMNVYTLGKQLLPPMFRSKFICSLLYVLLLPVIYVYSSFSLLRSNTDKKLNITPVIVLEKVLNDACGITGIYIETPDLKTYLSLFLTKEEMPPVFMGKKTEEKMQYIYKGMEQNAEASFIVKIPRSNDTSVNNAHIQTVTETLNLYKPAGKSFRTELYDL